jgi:hypothetical protein
MFFRNLLCTATFATLAVAAVAKQIPTPYTSEQSGSISEDFERDAEPEPARTAAWEQAHGGPAPSYKYGEEHDSSARHVAREANPMAEAEAEPEPGWANVGGNRQHKPGNWASRLSASVKNAVPFIKPFTKGGPTKFQHKPNHEREADGPESDTVAYDEELDPEDFIGDEELADIFARDPTAEELEIPDFGDAEVDTSLEGLLQRRDVEGGDDDEPDFDGYNSGESYDESQEDLSGYDAGILQRRSDGTADQIDYSLEGYDVPTFEDAEEEEGYRLVQARDLAEDVIAADDDYLHSDEHREFLASHGVTERSAEDDEEDAEHDRLDARSLNEILRARGTNDEYDGDEKGENSGADAVYADDEVVDEFTALEPELE